jgi:hypothetical protein
MFSACVTFGELSCGGEPVFSFVRSGEREGSERFDLFSTVPIGIAWNSRKT